mmetsp:Transcript_83818/g.227236  ORF Transcript_83818/g.227236 Transcript_83818/m.227236 type:complete len:201 (-) Transcript_83818:258-860(-)
MTEASFGIAGKDFVILATDCQSAFSIIKMKDDTDKITVVENKLFAVTGTGADATYFMGYMTEDLKLHTLRNGLELTTKAAATWTRTNMAQALRKNPFQVDMLVAGVDEDGPQLFFLDMYASMEKVNKAAHGYGAMFTFGLMDRFWHPDLTEEEGIALIKKCIKELETRFLVNLGRYTCKIVDKNGPRVLELYDDDGRLKP